jgi:uncharacterized protein YjbJ (UPF0337 family)
MGELTDKIKGTVNEAIGNVKEAVGTHTDNDALAADGAEQRLDGKGDKFKGALGDNI